jgi:hypothetical protein
MKFSTPDLLERFASEDDRIALPAHDELEQRSLRYHEHLKKIGTQLPARFLEMQNQFYLHDARVLLPGPALLRHDFLLMSSPEGGNGHVPPFLQSGTTATLRSSIILVLQLDAPPRELLVLHYRFARIDAVGQHFPLEEKLPFLEWRHDEVTIESSGERPEFHHSILFTNGLEITLRFLEFDYATLKPLESLMPCIRE